MAAGRREQLVVLYAVTAASTARHFLIEQIKRLADEGVEVHVVSSPAPAAHKAAISASTEIIWHQIPMSRKIVALADVLALVRLWRLLASVRPDILVASTPKASLLSLLIGRLWVRDRIYFVRGLRYEGDRGAKRALLRWGEALCVKLSTLVVANSASVATAMLDDGVARVLPLVLGSGSSNGVDVDVSHWSPEPWASRNEIVFIGRITKDKGISDLVATLARLRSRGHRIRLRIVGDLDDDHRLDSQTIRTLMSDQDITITGWKSDVRSELVRALALVLPSRREGFPNAVLDCAAVAIPAIGYDATGTRDAIVDGMTGRVVPYGDQIALTNAVEEYIVRPTLAESHGVAAQIRCRELFAREIVWRHWRQLLRSLHRAAQSDSAIQ